MAKNVTAPRRGRGTGLSQEDEIRFLDWLMRTGSPKDAATLAMVPLSAMKMRKTRSKQFRAAWDLMQGTKHKAMVEDFFARLEASGETKSAYLSAGLTASWFYQKMLRDPAFKARVERVVALAPDFLAKRILEKAKESDSVSDMIKVLERLTGSKTKPPQGG